MHEKYEAKIKRILRRKVERELKRKEEMEKIALVKEKQSKNEQDNYQADIQGPFMKDEDVEYWFENIF